MKTLICTVGLPRSGKTTWALQQGFPIVNPDSFRLAVYGQRFWGAGEEITWAIVRIAVRALFEAGHDHVILDATSNTLARRDAWSPDRETWDRTVFHVIDTPVAECMERADDDLKPIIERMAAAHETLLNREETWP